jgi:hypothetical protein
VKEIYGRVGCEASDLAVLFFFLTQKRNKNIRISADPLGGVK